MPNDPASLSNLRDIALPQPVSAWPPAPGFWVVLALALLWVAVALWLWARHRRRNAYRRVALEELESLRSRLSADDTRPTALDDLSVLLKRVALAAFPRETVATLTGEPWLRFLNGAAPGNPVQELPPPNASAEQASAFADEVASWIKTHRTADRHPASST